MKHVIITLITMLLLMPVVMVSYFSSCGETGCHNVEGGEYVLPKLHIAFWLVVLLVNLLFYRKSPLKSPPAHNYSATIPGTTHQQQCTQNLESCTGNDYLPGRSLPPERDRSTGWPVIGRGT